MTYKRFYLLTLQYTDSNSTNTVRTERGHFTGATESTSGEDMYKAIFDATCKKYGAPHARSAVLFYYLGKPEAE